MLEVLVGGFVVIVIGLAYLYATNKSLHEKVDKLIGHSTVIAAGPGASSPPAAVDHAAIIQTALHGAATIVAAAAGAPPPVVAAAPVPAGIPLGPVGADGKPTVVFPGGDLAAFRAFVGAALAQHGYGVTIVNTALQPLDVAGNVIATPGARDDTLAWSIFDGRTPTVVFKAGVPVTIPVTGVPAAQGFNFGWYEPTFPCDMNVTATRGGVVVASAGQGTGNGNGNGGILAVPGGDGDVSLVVSAPIDTQRAVGIKP